MFAQNNQSSLDHLPIDVIREILNQTSIKDLLNMRLWSKKHHQIFDQIVSQPKLVVDLIRRFPSDAMKFIKYYRTTTAYQALNQKYNNKAIRKTLLPDEIFCHALTTSNIALIDPELLQNSIEESLKDDFFKFILPLLPEELRFRKFYEYKDRMTTSTLFKVARYFACYDVKEIYFEKVMLALEADTEGPNPKEVNRITRNNRPFYHPICNRILELVKNFESLYATVAGVSITNAYNAHEFNSLYMGSRRQFHSDYLGFKNALLFTSQLNKAKNALALYLNKTLYGRPKPFINLAGFKVNVFILDFGFRSARLENCNFENSYFQNTIFNKLTLKNSNFQNVSFQGYIAECDLIDINMTNAQLGKAQALTNTTDEFFSMHDCGITNLNLKNATFNFVRFGDCRIKNINLAGVTIIHRQAPDISTQTIFTGCTISDCKFLEANTPQNLLASPNALVNAIKQICTNFHLTFFQVEEYCNTNRFNNTFYLTVDNHFLSLNLAKNILQILHQANIDAAQQTQLVKAALDQCAIFEKVPTSNWNTNSEHGWDILTNHLKFLSPITYQYSDTLKLILFQTDVKTMMNSRLWSKKFNYNFSQYIENPRLVLEIIYRNPEHAMEFINYYRTTNAYRDLNNKYQQTKTLTTAEIFCHALTTPNIASIDPNVLEKAIHDSKSQNLSSPVPLPIRNKRKRLDEIESIYLAIEATLAGVRITLAGEQDQHPHKLQLFALLSNIHSNKQSPFINLAGLKVINLEFRCYSLDKLKTISNCNLENASIKYSCFQRLILKNINLKNALVTGSIQNCELIDTSFANAQLGIIQGNNHLSFPLTIHDCTLNKVSFKNAQVNIVHIHKSKVKEINLVGIAVPNRNTSEIMDHCYFFDCVINSCKIFEGSKIPTIHDINQIYIKFNMLFINSIELNDYDTRMLSEILGKDLIRFLKEIKMEKEQQKIFIQSMLDSCPAFKNPLAGYEILRQHLDACDELESLRNHKPGN